MGSKRLSIKIRGEAPLGQGTRWGRYGILSGAAFALRKPEIGRASFRLLFGAPSALFLPDHDHVNRDISDSLQAQEELRRSEERLAKIFRSSPAGITISRRRDGCFLEANDAFLKIVGYTREQLIGHSSIELGILTPASRAEFVAAIAAHGYAHSVDLQLTSASGTVGDVLCSIEEIDYDGEPCLLIHSFDITARKRLERELSVSEQNYRLLADNSPDVIFQTDAAARLTYISPSIERLTGYTPAEILEMPFEALLAPPSMELLRVRRPQILALLAAVVIPRHADRFGLRVSGHQAHPVP